LPNEKQIKEVTLLNPYNPKEYESDKLTIVDIKAVDNNDRHYQIEIQLSDYGALQQRILYSCSHMYKSQLEAGQGYHLLKPVISIWLLTKNMIPIEQSDAHHHCFELVDTNNNQQLTDQCQIHVLELSKWHDTDTQIQTPEEYWLYFFKNGKTIDADNPPASLKNINPMRQAMTTLRRFSEQEKEYWRYHAREDFIRQQATIEFEKNQAEERERQAEKRERQAREDFIRQQAAIEFEKNQAEESKRQAEERERQAREDFNKKEQHLIELLKKHGIDPDSE
jgi:predicted transposase/invertase (TIGR01784 family)